MGSSDGKPDIRRLVDEFYQPLYRYAYRLSGSAADADDLTHDTFLKAQEQLGTLRDPTRAKNWLFSILRNTFLHRLRNDRSNRLVSLDSVGDVVAKPPEALPETERDLQTVLNELSEDWRTPIILFYFEEFSYRDIAEQMDLPIGTVMSRLARAKAYLRQRLRPSNGKPNGGA